MRTIITDASYQFVEKYGHFSFFCKQMDIFQEKNQEKNIYIFFKKKGYLSANIFAFKILSARGHSSHSLLLCIIVLCELYYICNEALQNLRTRLSAR